MTAGADPTRPSGGRIPLLDLCRTLALIGMAIFHFGFDLEAFGYVQPGTMNSGFWYYYARGVAGSFLFMVGISLWLAHGRGIRWRPFLKRLGQIVAGATLVTVATRQAFGSAFVFFGILHSIALSSVIGLAFLRLPPLLTLAAAVLAFYLPDLVAGGDSFASPWLAWTGLTPYTIYSVDFIPTFPWLAPVLTGIAVAKLADQAGLWQRLRESPIANHLPDWLAWPGRHGLFVYLIHQPILIALVWAATQFLGR